MANLATTLTRKALPTKPLLEWTYRDAAAAVAVAAEGVGAVPLSERDYAAAFAYCEVGDHWQAGATWIGPDGGGGDVRRAVLTAVERQFVPNDVIDEVLDRFCNALLKRPPALAVVPVGLEPGTEPSAAQRQDADTLTAALTAWAKRVRLVQLARLTVRRARWATRAPLRVFVPSGRRVTERPDDLTPDAPDPAPRLPGRLSLTDALAAVRLSAPLPNECAVVELEETGERAAIFTYREGGRVAAEVWTVNAEQQTEVRIVRDARRRGVEEEEPVALDLGGRLPIVELEAELLITEAVRRQQARLNFAESMLVRTLETSGFRERYIVNAAPDGHWTDRPIPGQKPIATETDGDGVTWYAYPRPRTLGSSVTTELKGIPGATDEQSGKETLTTPQVTFADPTDPAFVARAAEHARATILRSCRQGHVLGADAAQSGYSRDQARAEFEDDVTAHEEAVETMLREILEAALALARPMTAGGPDADLAARALDAYRIVCNLHVDTGPRSADERRADGEDVTAGRLSRETGMRRGGVVDVRAEIDAIDGDPIQRAVRSRVQAEAVAAWTTAGAGLAAAGSLVGMDEADVQTLVRNAGVAPGDDGITQ